MTLHRLIRDRRLRLPDDDDLVSELARVQLKETSPGVLRMDHAAGGHDDQAVAMALAANHLVSQHLPGYAGRIPNPWR
jgi:phage FluMu gp28-like protein